MNDLNKKIKYAKAMRDILAGNKNIQNSDVLTSEFDEYISSLERELHIKTDHKRSLRGRVATIVAASTLGVSSLSMTSCTSKDFKPDSIVEADSEDIPVLNGKSNSVTKTDATIAPTKVETKNNDEKFYNQINSIENDVVSFINDGISKGLVDQDVNSIDKTKLAKEYLNYYLMLNMNNHDTLNGVVFDILDMNKEMDSVEILNDSLLTDLEVQEQAVVSTNETKLDFDYLIKNESDKKVVKNLYDIVTKMHVAYLNNDKKTFDSAITEVLDVKNAIMAGKDEYSKLSPMVEDEVLLLIDIADQMANGTIITDNEDEFLNQAIEICKDGEYVSTLTLTSVQEIAESLGIDVTNKTKEALLEEIQEYFVKGKYLNKLSQTDLQNIASSLQIDTTNKSSEQIAKEITGNDSKYLVTMSIRSAIRVFADYEMQTKIKSSASSSIESRKIYDEKYSYNSILNNIVNRIDLTKFKRPEKSANDTINDILNKFYNYGYSASYSGTSRKGASVRTETHTTTSVHSELVDPSEVPSQYRVPETRTYTDANGNPTTKEKLEETKKAIEDGSKAAAEAAARGDFTPSQTGNEEYDKEYNKTLSQGEDVYKKAQSDETVTIVPVDNGEETTEKVEEVPTNSNTYSASASTSSSSSSTSSSSSSHTESHEEQKSSSQSTYEASTETNNTIQSSNESHSSNNTTSVADVGGEEEVVTIEDVPVGASEELTEEEKALLQEESVKTRHM